MGFRGWALGAGAGVLAAHCKVGLWSNALGVGVLAAHCKVGLWSNALGVGVFAAHCKVGQSNCTRCSDLGRAL